MTKFAKITLPIIVAIFGLVMAFPVLAQEEPTTETTITAEWPGSPSATITLTLVTTDVNNLPSLTALFDNGNTYELDSNQWEGTAVTDTFFIDLYVPESVTAFWIEDDITYIGDDIWQPETITVGDWTGAALVRQDEAPVPTPIYITPTITAEWQGGAWSTITLTLVTTDVDNLPRIIVIWDNDLISYIDANQWEATTFTDTFFIDQMVPENVVALALELEHVIYFGDDSGNWKPELVTVGYTGIALVYHENPTTITIQSFSGESGHSSNQLAIILTFLIVLSLSLMVTVGYNEYHK